MPHRGETFVALQTTAARTAPYVRNLTKQNANRSPTQRATGQMNCREGVKSSFINAPIYRLTALPAKNLTGKYPLPAKIPIHDVCLYAGKCLLPHRGETFVACKPPLPAPLRWCGTLQNRTPIDLRRSVQPGK